MTEIEKYVRRHLKTELARVEVSGIAMVENGLDIYEKTLIYYYTREGYQSINRSLRTSKGKRGTKAAMLLKKAISKLPDFRGLVYRSTQLRTHQLELYRKSAGINTLIIEHAFVSSSCSPGRIRMNPGSNVEFQIISKHGKLIEEYSCMGLYTPPNEREVLFAPGRTFRVLEVNDSQTPVLITLEEI